MKAVVPAHAACLVYIKIKVIFNLKSNLKIICNLIYLSLTLNVIHESVWNVRTHCVECLHPPLHSISGSKATVC